MKKIIYSSFVLVFVCLLSLFLKVDCPSEKVSATYDVVDSHYLGNNVTDVLKDPEQLYGQFEYVGYELSGENTIVEYKIDDQYLLNDSIIFGFTYNDHVVSFEFDLDFDRETNHIYFSYWESFGCTDDIELQIFIDENCDPSKHIGVSYENFDGYKHTIIFEFEYLVKKLKTEFPSISDIYFDSSAIQKQLSGEAIDVVSVDNEGHYLRTKYSSVFYRSISPIIYNNVRYSLHEPRIIIYPSSQTIPTSFIPEGNLKYSLRSNINEYYDSNNVVFNSLDEISNFQTTNILFVKIESADFTKLRVFDSETNDLLFESPICLGISSSFNEDPSFSVFKSNYENYMKTLDSSFAFGNYSYTFSFLNLEYERVTHTTFDDFTFPLTLESYSGSDSFYNYVDLNYIDISISSDPLTFVVEYHEDGGNQYEIYHVPLNSYLYPDYAELDYPCEEGYRFLGWTLENGSDEIVDLESFVVTGETHFYPVLEKLSVQINFYLNSDVPKYTLTVEYDEFVEIPDVDPSDVPSGYRFKGWNTEQDGSGTWYYPGQTIYIDESLNIIIFEEEEEMSYSMTLDKKMDKYLLSESLDLYSINELESENIVPDINDDDDTKLKDLFDFDFTDLGLLLVMFFVCLFFFKRKR